MARAQAGSSAKFVWPLVIFGAGFVICLLLAIIFYTQLTDARTRATEAESNLGNFITEGQRSGPAAQQYMGAEGNQSVFQTMNDRINTLKGIIGVSNDTSISQIQAQLQQQTQQQNFQAGSYSAAVRQLTANLNTAQEQLQQTQQQLQQAQGKIQSLNQQQQAMAQQFDQARQQLKSQYTSQQQQNEQVQSRLASMREQLNRQMSQSRQQLQQQISQLEQEKQQLTEQNNQLQEKMDNLLSRPGMTEVGAQIARPDGQISSILDTEAGGQQQAYINLGRADHLRLGTTFEVFAADSLVDLSSLEGQNSQGGQGQRSGRGIRLNQEQGEGAGQQTDGGQQGVRGKATIEVYQVNETSALVRVVRGGSVSEGDVLVNLIYSPNQQVTFHVAGDFDLNGDGNATSQDRERLKSIIREWGGKVVDELDYQVDFLVLGQQPQLPGEGQGQGDQQAAGPRQQAEQQAAQQKYQQYQALVQQARQLAIPVLNKNRFLSLIGYYQR